MECRWPISAATGISQATYFNWKRKYDGLLPTEMRRLSELSYQGLPNNQIKFESARGAGSGFPLIGAGARSLCWVMVATLRCDKFNTK
jgi:hypothetical protein